MFLVIFLIFVVGFQAESHEVKVHYPVLYKVYSSQFDEMKYSKAIKADSQLAKYKANYAKDRPMFKIRAFAEQGVNFELEGNDEFFFNNGNLYEKDRVQNITNYGIKGDYILYNGNKNKHESDLYKNKGRAYNILSKRHKRIRSRFYLAKHIEFFTLMERQKNLQKNVDVLRKLKKRYTRLHKNRAASIYERELISNRLIMYEQKLLKLKYETKSAYGLIGPKSRKVIDQNYGAIISEFHDFIAHDFKTELRYCHTYDLEMKYLRYMDNSYKAEAAFRSTEFLPIVELRTAVIRKHDELRVGGDADGRVSIVVNIPLFDERSRKDLRTERVYRTRKNRGEINFKREKEKEYEQSYRYEQGERKKLLLKLKDKISLTEKNRFYNLKMLRKGIIKVEDFLSLLDVVISTSQFHIDEKWKYMGNYYFNSMLCEFQQKKGV